MRKSSFDSIGRDDTEESRPELLRELEIAFEGVAQALVTAAGQRSFSATEGAAELFDLKEQGNGKPVRSPSRPANSRTAES
jgi:hypothetical protein